LGLATLESQLTDPAAQQAFAPLAAALRDNLERSDFGQTESNKAERFRLIGELDRLALDYTGGTFNAMCKRQSET
jgi:hypothetical protein